MTAAPKIDPRNPTAYTVSGDLPTDPVPKLDPRSPPATDDLEQLKRDLDEFGFCYFKDFLSAGEVARQRARLTEQAQAEREQGLSWLFENGSARIGKPRDGEDGWNNQIVRNLFNKGDEFHPCVLDPKLNALLAHGFKSRGYYVMGYQGLLQKQGSEAQTIHTDQMYVPIQTPEPYAINAMVMLTDFTDENGGTRLVPFSHHYQRFPPVAPKPGGGRAIGALINAQEIETIAATGPAGTALVFDGRIWHGAGPCKTNTTRLATSIYYGRNFLRQLDNIPASLHPDVYDRMSEEMKAAIGYAENGNFGRLEPQVPGGATNTTTVWPYTPMMKPQRQLE